MFPRSATQRQEVNSRKADEVFAEDAGSQGDHSDGSNELVRFGDGQGQNA
jgi:hypothetical protein